MPRQRMSPNRDDSYRCAMTAGAGSAKERGGRQGPDQQASQVHLDLRAISLALTCIERAPGMEHVGFSPRARGDETHHT